jgi:hypothetical protein
VITLVDQDKIDAALAKEFPAVDADRKKVLLQHVQHAIGRHAQAELHEIFSKNLEGGELAFYNAITVVHREPKAAPAASQPAPAPESPEAAADAHSEGANAADATAARSRSR